MHHPLPQGRNLQLDSIADKYPLKKSIFDIDSLVLSKAQHDFLLIQRFTRKFDSGLQLHLGNRTAKFPKHSYYLLLESLVDLSFGACCVGRERCQNSSRCKGRSWVSGKTLWEELSSRVSLIRSCLKLCWRWRRCSCGKRSKSADLGRACHQGDERWAH